ncbi:GAP family protein [Streptosporangium soli]|nr:GAP family protein [Streptosporangium sp. KLBMP 9127]
MGEAFADMLPYTLGLIVSPFPVVAVIALLISANGRAKALLFEATWLIMSWVVLITLLGTLGATGHAKPTWLAWLALIIGVFLLVMAFAGIGRAARRQASRARPRWRTSVGIRGPPAAVGCSVS